MAKSSKFDGDGSDLVSTVFLLAMSTPPTLDTLSVSVWQYFVVQNRSTEPCFRNAYNIEIRKVDIMFEIQKKFCQATYVKKDEI